jgi:hypothetical protein
MTSAREKRKTNMKCALCGKEIKGRDYINASTPEKYKNEINTLLNRICAKYQTCWIDVPIEVEVEGIEK